MEGGQRIQLYLRRAFAGCAPSEKSLEAQEALLADLQERYRDLLARGCDPEAAYQRTISSVGDIFELVHALQEEAAGVSDKTDTAKAAGDGAAAFPCQTPPGLTAGRLPRPLLRALPYLGIGLLAWLWLGRRQLPFRPGQSGWLLAFGLAAGAVAVLAWLLWNRSRPAPRRQAFRWSWAAYGALWAAGVAAFLAALASPRFSAAAWLFLPLLLALHQLLRLLLVFLQMRKEQAP